MLHSADKRLRNAEHYASEGIDKDSAARSALVERIATARNEIVRLQREPLGAGSQLKMQAAALELQKLARDIDTAELERWGRYPG